MSAVSAESAVSTECAVSAESAVSAECAVSAVSAVSACLVKDVGSEKAYKKAARVHTRWFDPPHRLRWNSPGTAYFALSRKTWYWQ